MDDDELDLIFKALSDRTRRRIIHYLSKRRDQSLFEVCSAAVAGDAPMARVELASKTDLRPPIVPSSSVRQPKSNGESNPESSNDSGAGQPPMGPVQPKVSGGMSLPISMSRCM